MSGVSLRQAFQACLWLAERQLDVPDADRQGVWDLADSKELKQDRRAIIEEIGEENFHNSIYHLPSQDLVDLSNSIDGPQAFSHGELTERSPFVVGGPQAVGNADYLANDLSEQIDNLVYQNAIETSALEQAGVVKQEQKVEKKTDPTDEQTALTTDPDLTAMMAEIKKGFENLNERISTGEYPIHRDQPKEDAPLHIQAHIQAHEMLCELLVNHTARATGYEVITSNVLECLKERRELETESTLYPFFWLDKPLPHYEYSMLHFGPGQNAYFQKQCDRKRIDFDPEAIKSPLTMIGLVLNWLLMYFELSVSSKLKEISSSLVPVVS